VDQRPITIKEILQKSAAYLKGREFVDSPRLEAEMLLSHVLKLERVQLYLNFDRPLTETELTSMREILKKRGTGYPMAYIMGVRGFYKSDFLVTPATLIPRPETEILVEYAIKQVKTLPHQDITICDFGAGTGAIGHSLALELPDARITLVEKSFEAFQVCQENAKRLGLQDKTTILNLEIQPGLLFTSKFDLIVANPPYISIGDKNVEPWVKRYEPEMALFSGEDGLSASKVWIQVASQNIKQGGLVIFEHGADQGQKITQIMHDNGFSQMNPIYDLANKWRHTCARKT
jgi:release factor glutamine methyltransferase